MKKISFNPKQYILKYYYWLMPVLMFLSFPSYDTPLLKFFPLFAWFALVPLLVYIRGLSPKKLFMKLFLVSLLANFLTYGWMGSFGNSVKYGNIVLVVALIPTLSVILTTKFFLGELLARRYPQFRMILFPFVWVLVDYLQSFGYLAFPWSYFGYSQYPVVPLIQMASVTGVIGLTWLIVSFNYALADFIISLKQEKFNLSNLLRCSLFYYSIITVVIFSAGFVRLAVSGNSNSDGEKKAFKVALIQTCISPWENWSQLRYKYLETLIDTTDQALQEEKADLIIWSESATLETVSYSYRRKRINKFVYYLLKYVKNRDIPLVTAEIGKNRRDDKKGYDYTNSAVLIDNGGHVVANYSKIHLAPIGEWFPYEKWLPGLQDYLESMGASSFTPGKTPVIFTLNGYRFGTLICYEGMFARLNRYYRHEMDADFLVNITNDGWSSFYCGHMQHYAASPFRAVENGVWFVRVGNTGFTTVIDPLGRVQQSIPILEKGYVNGEIDTGQNRSTFYSQFGELFFWIVSAFVAVLVILSEIKLKRSSM